MKHDTKSNNEKYPTFASTLNILGSMCLAVLPILFIVKIWINECYYYVINKLIYTDLIIIVGTLFMYWLLFYEKKQNKP